MIDYINPFNDFVFKYLFGREETSECLISLVNAVLADSDMIKITKVTILNPFNLKEYRKDKFSVLDIRAEDEKYNIYNIEIQLTGNEEYKYRSLYYWSRIYSGQLKESDDYGNLKPVICINILLFELFKELASFHTCFLAYEYKNKDILLTEHFQLHFLEIPKFSNNEFEINEKLKNWFKYLLIEGKEEEEKMKGILDKNEDIKKAHNEYKKFTADEKMRELYESRLKQKRDETSLLRYAKKEGKIEVALKMKEKQMDDNLICEITGLSKDEIDKLNS